MKKERRLLALILCLCMLFSMVLRGGITRSSRPRRPERPRRPRSPEQAEVRKGTRRSGSTAGGFQGAPSESNHPVQPEEDTETDARRSSGKLSPFTTQVPDGPRTIGSRRRHLWPGRRLLSLIQTEQSAPEIRSSNINNSDAVWDRYLYRRDYESPCNADGEKFLPWILLCQFAHA